MRFQAVALFTIISFLWTGCTSTNAFTKFKINPQKQRTFANLELSKISNQNNSIGTISAIYLNNILPKKYKQNEYFYVITYLRAKGRLTYSLNGNRPIKIKTLQKDNIYSHLLPISDNWHQAYLLIFRQIKDDNLVLKAKYSNYHSYALRYLKNQR